MRVVHLSCVWPYLSCVALSVCLPVCKCRCLFVLVCVQPTNTNSNRPHDLSVRHVGDMTILKSCNICYTLKGSASTADNDTHCASIIDKGCNQVGCNQVCAPWKTGKANCKHMHTYVPSQEELTHSLDSLQGVLHMPRRGAKAHLSYMTLILLIKMFLCA